MAGRAAGALFGRALGQDALQRAAVHRQAARGFRYVAVAHFIDPVLANAERIVVNENFGNSDRIYKVGVYPNPYRVNAAWDGLQENERKINFYNLPARAEVRVYTVAGDIVGEFTHDSETYTGDIGWFSNFSDDPRVLAGGEHAWDLQSNANQILTTGLYLYAVKDMA